MNERIFKVDIDGDYMQAGIDFWKNEVKPYIPQLYAQLRPIIGHDAPWTREEYDHAVMKLYDYE